MSDQHLTDTPISGDEVDHALGKTRFATYFSKQQSGERSVFGRLEHHRISHGESGGDFPGKHQEWEIPGNHLTGHANCPMIGHFLVHQLSRSRMVVKMAGNEGDVDISTFTDRFAVVHGFEDGEKPRMLLHQTGQGVEMLGAAGSTQILPSGLSIAGGLHRQINVFLRGLRNLRQGPTVAGISAFKEFAA